MNASSASTEYAREMGPRGDAGGDDEDDEEDDDEDDIVG
jgi:hypothetical protein